MNKKSTIGEKLVKLISPIIGVSYLQAEVNKFPYCAYDIESQNPVRDKQGIRAYKASVSVYVVADRESQADSLKDQIVAALKNDNSFGFILQNTTASTDSGHWSYRLEYLITQIL